MRVFIVVVTYNGIQWIQKCLDSCKGYHVIVVDNHSTDSTLEIIKNNYPGVTVLEQGRNLGFGAANNIGISYALQQDCDYVFLLNQDAYLKPNTIENLVKVHQENPNYAILSPIHINGKEDSIDRNFSYYLSHDQHPNFYFDAISNNLKSIYKVPFVNAAAWLLPRTTLETIGGFDPMFFHYGEDDNYCQRVKYHKYFIGVVPNVFVIHDRVYKKKLSVKLFCEDYFKEKEKHFKVIWGNINIEPENNINSYRKKVHYKLRRSRLKLDSKSVNNYKKEIALINNLESEILKSREINKQKGKHYISK